MDSDQRFNAPFRHYHLVVVPERNFQTTTTWSLLMPERPSTQFSFDETTLAGLNLAPDPWRLCTTQQAGQGARRGPGVLPYKCELW
jgi:hypothetical protein